jgi:hypothetical protein
VNVIGTKCVFKNK